MLTRINKAMAKKDSGFTLIELLVVMIIIGILAAIAIPVFLNQREAARETSAKADVSSMGKEIAAYYVDGTEPIAITTAAGTWTATPTTAADVFTGTLSGTNQAAGTVTSGTDFCVQVTSFDGTTADTPWSYSAAGLAQGPC